MTRIIRYRTQLPQAAANEELVRAVFAELQRTQPGGLSYAVYRREDEFVHLVKHLAGPSPLLAVQAFGEFQAGLPGRYAQPPTRTEFQEIATYQNGL
jgi:hypothetical protein